MLVEKGLHVEPMGYEKELEEGGRGCCDQGMLDHWFDGSVELAVCRNWEGTGSSQAFTVLSDSGLSYGVCTYVVIHTYVCIPT